MTTPNRSLNGLTKRSLPPQRQLGATLIVTLVMLLLISLLAIGGMQSSILQERMSSNAHDGAIAFQAAEAALRQAETDLMNSAATRNTAQATARVPTPWNWDGANPGASGTGSAGTNVSAQPAYHNAYLADVLSNPVEIGSVTGVFERFEITSRGQGGSADAVTVLQSTVLLPPE